MSYIFITCFVYYDIAAVVNPILLIRKQRLEEVKKCVKHPTRLRCC